jgi:hypothetical protein
LTEEINCVKTHFGEVLIGIKETQRRIRNVEEITAVTRGVLREEAVKTRNRPEDRLQHIERGLEMSSNLWQI